MPSFLIIFGAKYLIVAAPLLVIAYFVMAKTKRADLVRFAVAFLPLAAVLVLMAGVLWYNPRPFVVGNFVPLVSHAADNGFPSDHTILSAACAALLWPFSRRWSLVGWLIAILVGASRVAAGVHHSIDIVGSLMIAVVAAFVAWKWIYSPNARENY